MCLLTDDDSFRYRIIVRVLVWFRLSLENREVCVKDYLVQNRKGGGEGLSPFTQSIYRSLSYVERSTVYSYYRVVFLFPS